MSTNAVETGSYHLLFKISSELANCEQNPKIFIDAVNLTCKSKWFQTFQDKQTKIKTS